jgi:hypothetical protein
MLVVAAVAAVATVITVTAVPVVAGWGFVSAGHLV